MDDLAYRYVAFGFIFLGAMIVAVSLIYHFGVPFISETIHEGTTK